MYSSLMTIIACEQRGARMPASGETADRRDHFIKLEGREVFIRPNGTDNGISNRQNFLGQRTPETAAHTSD